ncbi:MAG: RNA polymerase sigma factor [Isosphaeraceae bacterium]
MRRARFLAMANAWIRHHRVNPAHFGAEDAIDEALLAFCRRILAGRARPVVTLDDLDHRFPAMLRQAIIDRGRFQHARRRGGRGNAISLSVLEESDFDRSDDRAAMPVDIAIAGEEYRCLLDSLRRRHPSLRAVAVMRMKQYTNAEIARVLGVSLATVERWIRDVRSLLRSRLQDGR